MSAGPLLSWGRHPALPQTPTPCHWPEDIGAGLGRLHRDHGSTLAWGNGRSYGDSCLAVSGQVLAMRGLDRFLHADWERGVLRAQAGVTLSEVLQAVIPRGWFLPVLPGTGLATLGGALANDVHGKNHHRRGSFGRHVRRFALLRSDGSRRVCSPDSESALFGATIGGLGLTGIVEWVELALMPIATTQLQVLVERFGTLEQFFALSDELDAGHEFCVAWIDCTAGGSRTGRGVYSAANFAASGPLLPAAPPARRVPFTPPFPLVNGPGLKLFNSLYWQCQPARRQRRLSDWRPFFHPLDGLLEWNRLYGKRGFQQYQCLLPECEARGGTQALLQAISDAGMGSFLAVLKRCGALPSPGLLSFPRPGVTLALDFPQSTRLETGLFPRLDAIVREAGGRLYPAKDAHMSAADFRRAYPEWERLEALRDPALNSHFWQRVST